MKDIPISDSLTNIEHNVSLQACRLAGLQACRLAGLQACRLAGLHTYIIFCFYY
jgi:hypothetical protein